MQANCSCTEWELVGDEKGNVCRELAGWWELLAGFVRWIYKWESWWSIKTSTSFWESDIKRLKEWLEREGENACFELFNEFCISAGKLLITPLILVLGLALGAIAVVIGKSVDICEWWWLCSTYFSIFISKRWTQSPNFILVQRTWLLSKKTCFFRVFFPSLHFVPVSFPLPPLSYLVFCNKII